MKSSPSAVLRAVFRAASPGGPGQRTPLSSAAAGGSARHFSSGNPGENNGSRNPSAAASPRTPSSRRMGGIPTGRTPGRTPDASPRVSNLVDRINSQITKESMNSMNPSDGSCPGNIGDLLSKESVRLDSVSEGYVTPAPFGNMKSHAGESPRTSGAAGSSLGNHAFSPRTVNFNTVSTPECPVMQFFSSTEFCIWLRSERYQ